MPLYMPVSWDLTLFLEHCVVAPYPWSTLTFFCIVTLFALSYVYIISAASTLATYWLIHSMFNHHSNPIVVSPA